MRVLIVDKLAPGVAEAIQSLGSECVSRPGLKDDEFRAVLAELNPEVIVVRSTKVTKTHVAAAKSLALIIRAGAGVNTIDLEAASLRGVYVTNCPGQNAAAVAELAIAHLLNLDRRISDNVDALRRREWNKKEFSRARGLKGRTLAVLGCGQIGREVIQRAQGLAMNVVAWSRSLTEAEAEVLRVRWAKSPVDAVAEADAVSVHLALAPETRQIIDAKVFEAMRDGAYFVNTSRGEVVDAEALTQAIRTKGVRAGLDVFALEPAEGKAEMKDPIVGLAEVYGTHHIGASTDQAEEAVGAEVVRIVRAYRQGDAIPNCVNLASRTGATHTLIVRHADRVGVLAHVLTVLREAQHNVQEMQNIVFSGAGAACARISIVGAPTEETLGRVGASDAIFAVSVAANRSP